MPFPRIPSLKRLLISQVPDSMISLHESYPILPNAYLIENCKKIPHRSRSYPRSNSHTVFERVTAVIHVTIGQAFQVSIYARVSREFGNG